MACSPILELYMSVVAILDGKADKVAMEASDAGCARNFCYFARAKEPLAHAEFDDDYGWRAGRVSDAMRTFRIEY